MPPLPDPGQLEAQLTRMGLEAPSGMRLSPAPERGLVLQTGNRELLLVCVEPTTHRSVLHAEAAWEAGRSLPLPADRAAFGGTWILRSPAPGAPATRPDQFADVAWTTLDLLASRGAPRFGHEPGEGTFWPRADTWADAIARKAEAFARRARARDVEPGLIDGALGWIADRRDALDALDRFALVHGGLGPLQTRVGPTGKLLAITDWTRAHFGDPLEDWIRYLTGPPDAVQLFLRGRTAEQPTGAQLSRLEVYAALAALELLGEGGADPARAVQGQLAGITQLRALKNGWIRRAFGGGRLPERRIFQPWERVVAMLVGSLRTARPEDASARLGALAAGALAARVPDAALSRKLWEVAASELARARKQAHHLEPDGERPAIAAGTSAIADWILGQLAPRSPLVAQVRDRLRRDAPFEAPLASASGFVGAALDDRIDALIQAARNAEPRPIRPEVVEAVWGLVDRPDVGSPHLPLFTAMLALADLPDESPSDLVVLAGLIPGPVMPGTSRVLFAVPSRTGWGELTLALRVARALLDSGIDVWFSVTHAQLAGLRSQGFGVLPFPSDQRGPALVEALRRQLSDFDAWVLVDLHLGGSALLDKSVRPAQVLDLGPPLVGLDIWDYRRIGRGLDIAERSRSRVDADHWKGLERRLVPVPFAPLDTDDGCALLPTIDLDGPSPKAVRAELGVGSRPLILLCTSFWQHEMMEIRQTPDVVSLLAHHLDGIEGDWHVLHIGPEPLALRETLGARYQHHRSMPAERFHAVVAAASLVLSLNASATTNTTAVALGTPVVALVQRQGIESAAALAPEASGFVRAWVARHAPVPRFAMWPMCMVEALDPLLRDSAYGALMNLVEILDERAVRARLGSLLYDDQARAAWQADRAAYLAQLDQLPGPVELFRRHTGLG